MLTAHNIQLFDVREPYELVESGKIACATNIPRMFFSVLFSSCFLHFELNITN